MLLQSAQLFSRLRFLSHFFGLTCQDVSIWYEASALIKLSDVAELHIDIQSSAMLLFGALDLELCQVFLGLMFVEAPLVFFDVLEISHITLYDCRLGLRKVAGLLTIRMIVWMEVSMLTIDCTQAGQGPQNARIFALLECVILVFCA